VIHPFVIVSLQRSGTTFLRHALSNHPDIICHGEIFMHGLVGGVLDPVPYLKLPKVAARDADPVGFLDTFLSFHEKGHVGFKLMLNQNQQVLEEIVRRKWPLIVVWRENLLARFSSLLLTRATGQSHARVGREVVRAQVDFDPRDFKRFRNREVSSWAKLIDLEDFADSAILVEYCDLVASGGLRRVFEHLGIEPVEVKSRLQKQNSSAIVERFTNPDAVLADLESIGHPEWAREEPGSRPEPITKWSELETRVQSQLDQMQQVETLVAQSMERAIREPSSVTGLVVRALRHLRPTRSGAE
jgi:hypothetical protein